MQSQFNKLKNQIAAESNWVTEVADVGNEADYIHGYFCYEDNPFPRATIMMGSWSGDYSLGACNESASARVLVEIQRDIPTDSSQDALDTQYLEVIGWFRDFAMGLSQSSYGSPSPATPFLGNIRVEIPEGVWMDTPDEDTIPDPNAGTPKVTWYAMLDVVPEDFT